jgi:hypothetical protein
MRNGDTTVLENIDGTLSVGDLVKRILADAGSDSYNWEGDASTVDKHLELDVLQRISFVEKTTLSFNEFGTEAESTATEGSTAAAVPAEEKKVPARLSLSSPEESMQFAYQSSLWEGSPDGTRYWQRMRRDGSISAPSKSSSSTGLFGVLSGGAGGSGLTTEQQHQHQHQLTKASLCEKYTHFAHYLAGGLHQYKELGSLQIPLGADLEVLGFCSVFMYQIQRIKILLFDCLFYFNLFVFLFNYADFPPCKTQKFFCSIKEKS